MSFSQEILVNPYPDPSKRSALDLSQNRIINQRSPLGNRKRGYLGCSTQCNIIFSVGQEA